MFEVIVLYISYFLKKLNQCIEYVCYRSNDFSVYEYKKPKKNSIWQFENEKVCKVAFQALLERLISVIYFENPNSQNLLLAPEPNF